MLNLITLLISLDNLTVDWHRSWHIVKVSNSSSFSFMCYFCLHFSLLTLPTCFKSSDVRLVLVLSSLSSSATDWLTLKVSLLLARLQMLALPFFLSFKLETTIDALWGTTLQALLCVLLPPSELSERKKIQFLFCVCLHHKCGIFYLLFHRSPVSLSRSVKFFHVLILRAMLANFFYLTVSRPVSITVVDTYVSQYQWWHTTV